jgi:hypothetical protein
MIDQINLPPAHYGADIRFRYFSKTSGLYYNRTLAAYEAYDAANHAAYLIATNENPAGKFTATRPTGVTTPAEIDALRYVDGTPANDYVVGSGEDNTPGQAGGITLDPESSTITFRRVFRQGAGVLTDVATATITITRVDTGATVVASTNMTRVSLGTYEYTLANPEPGVLYRGTSILTALSGDSWETSSDLGIPGTRWTYSDINKFNLFNGTDNTAQEADPDRDNLVNNEVVFAAGMRGDTYIDSRLAEFGWPVPLTGMDARTTRLLEDLSNHAARWQLAEAHQFGLLSGRNVQPDTEGAIAKADKAYVDEWLDRIFVTPDIIVATNPPGIGGTSTGGAISVSVGPAKIYPGTGGVLIPTASVANAPSPYSW